MNSMQIKDKIRNISQQKKVDINTILRLYMYDRFLERLSISNYKDNFILKGGFYLSVLFGVDNRTTMDIDTAIRNANFTKENIEKMIFEIAQIDLKDNCKIEIKDITNIRDADDYGGFRVTLIVKIENMKDRFQLDIATGDPITPSAIVYKYKPILRDTTVKLWAYNIETILAEKVETILKRAEASSRMRDYYDIYLIYNKEWENVNKENLRNAMKNTFEKRGFLGNVKNIFEYIKNSSILEEKWKNYSKTNNYSKNIEYKEIMNCLNEIINEVI